MRRGERALDFCHVAAFSSYSDQSPSRATSAVCVSLPCAHGPSRAASSMLCERSLIDDANPQIFGAKQMK